MKKYFDYDEPTMTSPPVTLGELRAEIFPEPKYYVLPWMTDQSLSMLYSWRGIGKTYFCLGLAQAIASGSTFLKWPCPASKVFYFDCEMGHAALRKRFDLLDSAATLRAPEGHIRLFSFEDMGGKTWNLANPKMQITLDTLLQDANVLIIDNLSAACRPIGKETFQDAYFRFRDWMLSLKRKNIAVLLVHHAGKSGAQRGISDIEDPLDIVINLRRSDGWKPTDGTTFEFHFEKTRALDPHDSSVLASLIIELKSLAKDKIEWRYGMLEAHLASVKAQKTKESIEWGAGGEDDLF